MAASPKSTPIDDRVHFLSRAELERLQELKAKLGRLRVEITDAKSLYGSGDTSYMER